MPSKGRIEVLFSAGYRPSEFDMLAEAWAGKSFRRDDHTVQVTPRPSQRPVPGSPLPERRTRPRGAAPFGAHTTQSHLQRTPMTSTGSNASGSARSVRTEAPGSGLCVPYGGGGPEVAWDRVGPFALHEMNTYAKWTNDTGRLTEYRHSDDVMELRRTGQCRILNPQECVAAAADLRPEEQVILHPRWAACRQTFRGSRFGCSRIRSSLNSAASGLVGSPK
jgi:hypothetical protein